MTTTHRPASPHATAPDRPASPLCRLAALGMVNALGSGVDAIWPRLLAGDPSGFRESDAWLPDRSLWVGEVSAPLPDVPAELSRYACRNSQLALAALAEIDAPLRAAIAAAGPERVGVVMGTSTSGVGDAEAALRHKAETGGLAASFRYDQLEFGGVAGFVADHLGARGPVFSLSTACSSGARALASARSLIALGICDVAIAGAADSLCGLTTNGFHALQALSNAPTNPCSLNRRGLTLGEGAALFLVTAESGGIQLEGVGESSEAHHMSAPEPEGHGAEAAMRGALRDAGVPPDSIAYLNLHGTGTPQNDSMECAATHRVLGESVPCSSTKSLVGHTLGAAGAMEAGFCWLALRAASRAGDGNLPLLPHSWDGVRDPELAPVRLASKGETARVGEHVRAMTNSFGFGGNNCVLILGCEGVADERAEPIPLRAGGSDAPVAVVRGWSAWAPGVEDAEAWRAWSAAPRGLPAGPGPEARFIPAMQRRRCTPLSRIFLTAGFAAADETLLPQLRTVFASRHGSINESIDLLDAIVKRQRLSPLKFSHTVHNAQAGLFSIAAGNREASSSLAGQEDSFAGGYLEALCHLEREPERPVLLLMGDVPLAPTFAPLVDEPVAAYALALILARDGEGPRLALTRQEPTTPVPPTRDWPDALEFLRWFLDEHPSRAPRLEIGSTRAAWSWTRA